MGSLMAFTNRLSTVFFAFRFQYAQNMFFRSSKAENTVPFTVIAE